MPTFIKLAVPPHFRVRPQPQPVQGPVLCAFVSTRIPLHLRSVFVSDHHVFEKLMYKTLYLTSLHHTTLLYSWKNANTSWSNDIKVSGVESFHIRAKHQLGSIPDGPDLSVDLRFVYSNVKMRGSWASQPLRVHTSYVMVQSLVCMFDRFSSSPIPDSGRQHRKIGATMAK